MVEELTLRYGEEVTVILRSAQRGQGPRIARLPGVRLIERSELDQQAFLAADVPTARGIALLHQDDLGNFHAALRAQELNADLRLLVAIPNPSPAHPLPPFLPHPPLLPHSSITAPS